MDNIDSEFSFRKMIKQIFNRLENLCRNIAILKNGLDEG